MNLEIEINYNIAKGQLFSMAMFVQKALEISLESLIGGDNALAKSVINDKDKIKAFEIKVNESSLSMLLFDQTPSRMIGSILSFQKLNHLLEGIGKHVVQIAASASKFYSVRVNDEHEELARMAEYCLKVYTEAIDCFFEKNITSPDGMNVLIKNILSIKTLILHKTIEKLSLGQIYFQDALEIVNICKNIESVCELSTQINEQARSSFEINKVRLPRVHSSPMRELR